MKIKAKIYSKIILLLIIFNPLYSFSEVIEFATEELARESVLPKFKHSKSVMNKNVPLSGRFELNIAGGYALNEAYYNPVSFGGGATYYLNEIHGINFSFNKWADGLTKYSEQLRTGEGLSNGEDFDPSLAPHAEQLTLFNYQYSAYYGKISLTKQGVMNLAIYGLLGGGTIKVGEKSSFVLNVGLGQKFYFSKHVALRMDLNLYSFNAPDPASIPLRTGTAMKDYDDFEIKNYISSNLSFGLSVLF
ncbi:MAG: outer membrane beta-barrel domain-containing protein [Bdellovibrionaceae bacterium]|jgi:outer membrane beta-barrel protein|nr:outer membrane beta-barrel domain-containing protein [Pseudobdellovibrionaceae bacterium]